MAGKDVQDYLDKGMYGSRMIKPDEQKKYLGTFRERVIFIVLSKEAQTKLYDSFCLNKFESYPKGTLLINANCPPTIQNHFIMLAQKKNIQFRLVDTSKEKLAPDDIAIVFSASSPVNIEDIFVKETSHRPIANDNKQVEKSSFFKRLFKF